MHYIEKINPSYYDLLLPLKKWRIMSLRALKSDAEYSGSASGFYKIISKLEKYMLIDSFINSWSNEKFLYLLPDGIKALGGDHKSLNLNRDLRFHDSLVSKVSRIFQGYRFVNDIILAYEIKERFPLIERIPDCIVEGEIDKKFLMAIEVELTQKSQDRVKQIFKSYSESKVVNNVLYITDKMSIFNTYKRYLNQLGGDLCREKFLLMHAKDLCKKSFCLEFAPIYFKETETDLNSIFKNQL